MSESKPRIDAVALMRDARAKLSAAIEGMTLEQELEWLAAQDLQDPLLTRLRERASQVGDCAGRRSAEK